MKTMLLTLAVCALGLGLVPATAGSNSVERSSVKRVSAFNNYFSPRTVKVRRGGKVVWRIREGIHNVRGSGMKSANIRKGGTYSKKFKRSGKYPYVCTLHPGMKGVVKVR